MPSPADDATPEKPPERLQGIVLRGARLAGIGHFATQGVTLITYLAIARLLSPAEYGVYAGASLFVGLGLMVSGAGINAALVQRQDRFDEARNTAVISSLMSGLGLSLLSLALSPLVGLFFRNPEVGVLSAALSGTILLRTATIVPDALMQRRFSFVRRLVIDPAAAVAFGVAGLGFLAMGWEAWGLVAATYVAAICRLALSWGLAGWRPEPRKASRGMWLELAGYARHVLSGEILRRLALEMPAAVLGRYYGADAIGNYRYAQRIGIQPHAALTAAASYVLLPAFARMATDIPRLHHAFMRSLRWLGLVAIPSGLLLLPLGEPIAVVMLGERWREAGLIMAGLSVYVASRFPISLASEILKATGATDRLPRMHGIAAVTTALSVVALYRFGGVAIAVGLSVSSLVTSVYAFRCVAPMVGATHRQILAEIAAPIAATLVMVVGVGALDALVLEAADHGMWPGLPLLVVDGVIAVILYLAALRLFAPKLARELATGARRTALSMVRSRRKTPAVPASAD